MIDRPALSLRAGDATPLEMFDHTARLLGESPFLYSHDVPISAGRMLALSNGLAVGMAAKGVERGARVALYLQNDPQFILAMLAIWRLGAIAVPCNPMLRERELAHHLRDAGASALVTLDGLYRDVAAQALPNVPGVRLVLSTGGADPRDTTAMRRLEDPPAGTHDLLTLAEAHEGALLEATLPRPQDVAVLTYTSGTTGPPKGAMNTHGNIAHAARIYRDWLSVDDNDTILGIAPLYHVTGLTGHIGLALASGASLILAHRFDAAEAARLAEAHRATVVIAAITAYVAIANDERARAHDLSSLRHAYSGGAPIPPKLVGDLAERLGIALKPVYGLTETTGPTNLCPPDLSAPVDPGSGALAVGVAASETSVRILAEDGSELGPGQAGEVAISGPQVVPGYWGDPEEARDAIRDGEMLTGDIGIVDEDGWLYLVDRLKDMISASGFKVWPREVEDVLYEHDAVREAAVIGVPDDYRGETVWGYVSLKPGRDVEPAELVAHCRARLAAYKYPRVVHVLDELPKTPTGKILRRELRGRGDAGV
jgi:long-chain acyl-CoA synthetase